VRFFVGLQLSNSSECHGAEQTLEDFFSMSV
jgi:hypothetical protein